MKKIIRLSIVMPVLAVSLFMVRCTGNEQNVFDKEYIKSTMEAAVNWQFANPKHDPRDWTNGAFYAGVYAAWETTGSQAIYDAMVNTFTSVGWTPYRRWFHADDIAICQTYVDLYRIEKRPEMIQAFVDTLNKLIENPYPVKGIEIIKWWWCDALFMGPPAMVKVGLTTGNMEYLAKSDEYFMECYDLLYDHEERLFARDLDFVIKGDENDRFEANGKKIFWSRGNGWVMGGLARMLQELPRDYPKRPFYEQLFKDMAARIKELQPEDGLWRASLLDPDSYPGGEASGSGFYCYALAYGINSGLLDNSYLPAVEKAWIGLNRCLHPYGKVGWVQPIGLDPKRNFSEDSWEVYGTGAFLLAGSEVIKLKR